MTRIPSASAPRSPRSRPTSRASRPAPTRSSCRATRTRSTRCPGVARGGAGRDGAQPLSGCLGRPPARAPRRALRRRRPSRSTSARAASRSSRSWCSRPPAPATRSSTRGGRSRRTRGSRSSRARQPCRFRSPPTRGTTCRAMAAAITDRTRAIIVCSPNNPTGPIVTQAEFDEFLAAVPADVLVILDEAYAEFVTDPDAVDGLRVPGGPEGIRTSWCCAPSRRRSASRACAIGYAVGHPRILDAARSASIPLSVTAQAEEAALASLDAEAELLERVRDDRRAPRPPRGGAARDGMARPERAGQLRLAPRRRRDAGGRGGVRCRRPHRAARSPATASASSVGEEESVEKVLADRGIRCERPPRGSSGARASVER